LSSCFKNGISKVVGIISDTLLETISECSHDSFGHCRGKSGDFLANSVLEGLKEMEEMDVVDTWFQQDGAASHMARRSRRVLREIFLGKLISLRGDVGWPAHWPDLAPCYFFLRGYLKSKVYTHPPENLQALKDAIRQEIAAFPHTMTERIMRAFRNRLEECIANDGHHFGDKIFKT
jgi:hypothetical protein